MYRINNILAIVTQVLIFSWLICVAPLSAAGKPNILWIMTDDERPDAVGAYGADWAHTPEIDKVAAAGVRFQNAIATTPVCGPVRHAMLSGLYGHYTGLMSNRGTLQVPFVPLTQGFIDAGYQVSNIGKLHRGNISSFTNEYMPILWGGPGALPSELKPGFDPKKFNVLNLPDFVIISGTYPLPQDSTEAGITTQRALDFIESDLQEPYFLRVSYVAPHSPVLAPEPYDKLIDPDDVKLVLPTEEELASKPLWERTTMRDWVGSHGKLTEAEMRQSWATYYGLAAYKDHEMGRVIDALERKGMLENTIIVYASDQGVEMGEHGFYMKRNFYEETVRLPFVLSWPGHIEPGAVIDGQVEIIDLVPTLLDMADLPVPNNIHGKSAWPLVQGKTEKHREYAFSEINHAESQWENLKVNSGRRVMVRTNEWKLIYWIDRDDPDGALYDLRNDPNERRNLIGDPRHAAVAKRLMDRGYAWAKGEYE
jgi:arylsulfatase A-like enzyme